MAISPITIATQGLLNSPLSVAAVRGRLTIGDIPVPPTRPPGGNSGTAATWISPYVLRDRRRAQIEREDEEILAVIMAFMELFK
jgi:hypothetical protein